jgi:competence protein ComEC
VALVACAVALAAREARGARACACVALAAGSGLGLAVRLEQAAAAPAARLEATIEATVAAVQPLASGARVTLARVAAVDPPEVALPPRLWLETQRGAGEEATRLAALAPGERLRARVRVRPLAGRANPGGADRLREAARAGIGARAPLAHPELAVRRPDAEGLRPLAPLHRLRARAAARLGREGRGGALVAALGVGDRGGLDAGARDAFRRLGVSHLLSVSGLHLALAAALAFRLALAALVRRVPARWRADPREAALGAAVAVAAVYAVLAGFEVPVRRSLALVVGVALSLAARRPAPRGAPLVAAALLVLAGDPGALFELGAQLSFAASAALVWAARAASPPAQGLRARSGRALADALATTAAAGAATAPLAAGALGVPGPGWSLAANAVAIPWTGVALLPLSLAAALAAGLAPERSGTALLCGLAARLAEATLGALEAAAAHAPAAESRPVAPVALVLAAGLAFAAVCLRPLALRLGAALAVAFVLRHAPLPAIAPAPPRVVVLDVGQGDAVLVQGRTGALLVDAGTAVPDGPDLGATVVVPALRALGVRRLDLVVASHADLDHRGGLPAVLRAFPVARVWLPPGGLADPAFADVVASARAAGSALEEQGAGAAPLPLGDLAVEPLWPPRGEREGSRNDRSLTLRVELAGRRVLLPGDLEIEAERRLLASGVSLRADVLKLGHHGSRTSSSAAWLAAVDGAVAVASAPRAGRFGMPHREVVARLDAEGYALWWTGRDGAVLIGLAPQLRVRGWRRGNASDDAGRGAGEGNMIFDFLRAPSGRAWRAE